MPRVTDSKYLVVAGWQDAPHLDEKTKRELLESTPRYQREARSQGIPALGSGRIFPVEEELIRVDPFKVPEYWPQIIGIDFGWTHPTSAAKLAWDRDSDCVYLTHDYRQSEATVAVHAAAVKAWGDWVPVAWPHDGENETAVGEPLSVQYRKAGLLMLADKATHEPGVGEKEGTGGTSVEAGLARMLDRMMTGRWKVFSNCQHWFDEFRLYRREKGKVVKVADDTISASRYAEMMLRFAKTKPTRGMTLKNERQFRSAAFKPLNGSMGI